jgi:hypothetical protein
LIELPLVITPRRISVSMMHGIAECLDHATKKKATQSFPLSSRRHGSELIGRLADFL